MSKNNEIQIRELLEFYDVYIFNKYNDRYRTRLCEAQGKALIDIIISFNKEWLNYIQGSLSVMPTWKEDFKDITIMWLPNLIPQTEAISINGRKYIILNQGAINLYDFINLSIMVNCLTELMPVNLSIKRKLGEVWLKYSSVLLDGFLLGQCEIPTFSKLIPPLVSLEKDANLRFALVFMLYHELGHIELGHLEYKDNEQIRKVYTIIEEKDSNILKQKEYDADSYAMNKIIKYAGARRCIENGIHVLDYIANSENFTGDLKQTHPMTINRLGNLTINYPEYFFSYPQHYFAEMIQINNESKDIRLEQRSKLKRLLDDEKRLNAVIYKVRRIIELHLKYARTKIKPNLKEVAEILEESYLMI